MATQGQPDRLHVPIGHREAALTLLQRFPDLPRTVAGFLGNVCVLPTLTEKQRAWLVQLMDKHELPPLTSEEGA